MVEFWEYILTLHYIEMSQYGDVKIHVHIFKRHLYKDSD
jgi:hypothetical protein